MTTSLVTGNAVEFWPPVVAPSPHGLLPAVAWWPDEAEGEGTFTLPEMPNARGMYPKFDSGRHDLLRALEAGRGWYDGDDSDADRFLIAGVHFRTFNYGGSSSTGQWDESWCSPPTYHPSPTKSGTRPTDPDDYTPVVVWAYDQCDMSPYSYTEVKRNAQQWLRLLAPINVEQEFAVRMLADAGELPSAVDFTTALGQLEGAIAASGTVGYIHASATLASAAGRCSNIVHDKQTGQLKTHLGNIWVFGGGYVSTLENTLCATSRVYGWQSEAVLRDTVEERYNQFVAVAEQSFAVGYEAFLGASVYSPS